MKKLVSAALALITASTMLIMPATCSEAAGKNISYEKREVTAYIFDGDTEKTFTCLFRPDMNIPFISATDYLNQIYYSKFNTRSNGDGTYTVYNEIGEFVVDPGKDTVFFDEYEKVVYYDDVPEGEGTGIAEYLKEDEYNFEDENGGSLLLDLGKYDIDIAAYDGNVYFPLTTMSDIFAVTYRSAFYIDGSIYFDSAPYEDPYYDDPFFDSLDRDTTLIDYTYDELCFVVDNLYGRPEKAAIAEGIEKKGFDRSLDDYNELTAEAKKLLRSKDKVDFFYGLLYLDSVFDDGGHTSFSAYLMQAMDEKPDTVFSEALTDAMSDSSDKRLAKVWDYLEYKIECEEIDDQIIATRTEAYKHYFKVMEWDDGVYLYKNDKTAIFVFDEFLDDIVEPLKWSLNYAKENGMENFVVDLSGNGGGSVASAVYMLSVMTGNGDVYLKNVSTGSRMTETCKVDKNLDGSFDEKDDEIRYDLNYAILTSQSSFSCSNLVAAYAKERGIKILGEKSSGGSCLLIARNYPEPLTYMMSDTLTLVDENGNDLDGGVEPDVSLVTADMFGAKDYSGLYDINNINASISGEEVQVNANSGKGVLELLLRVFMGLIAMIVGFLGYTGRG